MTLAPPRGMRDFYPEDYRVREAIFDAWREAGRLHGFEGYDAPVVETEELLKRKSGEEIVDQIYAFRDKSGRGLALRPEMTPSLARMIVARQGSLAFPLKWMTVAQCFRYERMTRGRKREHYQWNLDVVGESSIMAEAETIGAAVEAMRRLGLSAKDFKVRVGSRALLFSLLESSGVAHEEAIKCMLIIDKRGKIDDAELDRMLEPLIPNLDHRRFLYEHLETKNERGLDGIRHLIKKGKLADFAVRAMNEIENLLSLSSELGFRDFLTLDLGIVRGLGYYTGIVFEAFDAAGKFRAIFGGGRYDNLLSALGGKPCTAVGLGFGDVVIRELLADLGRLPGGGPRVDYAVGWMNADCRAMAARAATALRARGASVDLALSPDKPGKFFSRADRLGAARAVLIGPDEVQSGELRVKDMASGEQTTTALDSL